MDIIKNSLSSLVDDVISPFEQAILNDETFKNYMNTDESKMKHNLGIAKIAIFLIHDLEGAKNLIIKAAKAHSNFDVDKDKLQEYLFLFFKLHRAWCLKHGMKSLYYEETIERYNDLFMKIYDENLESNEEDDFLFFENEIVEDVIDNMHYQDNKKITALDYSSYGEILDDEISSIVEIKENFENMIYEYNELTKEFLNEFNRNLSLLANIFFGTYEFKDIGYALNSFLMQLHSLDLSCLEEMQKNLGYQIIIEMINDIQNWIDKLFIDKSAIDIHYFDASLFANITQLDITLRQNIQESDIEEDDDDFLF